MLSGFDRELKTLLAAVAEVAGQLGGATTAEQAIKGDAGAAWKQLTALANDY